jgi:malate dehydrogenase
LRDAFDEFCPHLEVVVDIEAVEADIIVMAAGAALSHRFKTFSQLAHANVDVFDNHATQLLAKNKDSIVVIVSNPAEFAVESFVRAGFLPERVLGFGAHLDTLRFRRELASELGVSRQNITGCWVLGKHGLDMVPIWSNVKLAHHCPSSACEKLEELKEDGLARLPNRSRDRDELRNLAYEIRAKAEANKSLEAAAMVNRQPPDWRACLRRYISHFSGKMYPRVSIGENVAQLVLDIIDGRDTRIAAQVYMQNGDFLGIKDQAIGAPLLISCHGTKVAPIDLTAKEEDAVRASAEEAVALSQGALAIKLFRRKRAKK